MLTAMYVHTTTIIMFLPPVVWTPNTSQIKFNTSVCGGLPFVLNATFFFFDGKLLMEIFLCIHMSPP